MRKYRMVIIIIAAAVLALIGLYMYRGGTALNTPGTVTQLDSEDLPEGFMDNLESVKPEIDGFHFDVEEEAGSPAMPN